MIRFRVRNRRLKSVRLAAPGPNGKGVIAVTFPVQGPDLARYVEVPEGVQVGAYGEEIEVLIENGTLLPPAPAE